MANINQRLNGLTPLSYLGDNAVQPPDFVTKPRPPTTTDSKNFYLGDLWLDTSNYPLTPPTNQNIWMLVALIGNQATWVNLAAAPGILTLTGNSGGAVSPTLDNINIVGTGVITVVGNPGTSTLTVTPSGSIASSFITNPATGTATPVAGVLTFAGAGSTTVSAAGSTVTITSTDTGATSFPTDSGTATPSAGALKIWANNAALTAGSSVKFTGATNEVLLNVTDASNNTIIGKTAGNLTLTSSNCTGVGVNVLKALTSGTNSCALGVNALQSATTAGSCVAIGVNALGSNVSSSQNIAIGESSLRLLTAPGGGLGQNTAIGVASMENATTAHVNVAVGFQSLGNLLTGDQNICVGESSGYGYTGAEANNVILGCTDGTTGESNVMRLGNSGFVGGTTTAKTWIYGVRGKTTDVNDAIAVLIDSTGQLGTVSSSIIFKENVQDMSESSSSIMSLRPVTFNYKSDVSKRINYGLIAEEVEMAMPELVAHDHEGEIYSVRYNDLVPMLLNEIQKLSKRVAELEKR